MARWFDNMARVTGKTWSRDARDLRKKLITYVSTEVVIKKLNRIIYIYPVSGTHLSEVPVLECITSRVLSD